MSPRTLGAHLAAPVSEHDHSQGPDDAPATLVEYGDYECPACGAAYPLVAALQAKLGDELRFVFRNFPLSAKHPHAGDAARAAEAAGLQGKFWEMHGRLFEDQDHLEPDDLLRHAAALGLDLERFTQDFQSEACRRRVDQDFLDGARSGVNGTPTFFINGERYDGPHEFVAMAAALQQAADEAT